MILETVKTPGLAHLSYLLGDDKAGVCAVIDPRRDVDVYLDLARRHHCRITHVLETHIHADFVSGSRELAAQTGAVIHGGAADYGFDLQPLADGDRVELGSLTLEALHTPGHTPEHVSYVVSGGQGADAPWAVFTGDTLFAGEVGRPDLLGDEAKQTLARQLFDSLRNKLLALADEVEVYPAHGAGSPCGGNIGDRDSTTLGYERHHNDKLQIADEDAFVEAVLGSLPAAPRYYPRMKKVNAEGPPVMRCLPIVQPLDAEAFEERMGADDTLVLDTREIEAFAGAHIDGALNIAFREKLFAIWSGWMLDPEQELLLVLQDEEEIESIQRHLLRIGIDRIGGFLRQGIRGWIEAGRPFRQLGLLSVHDLKERIGADGLQVLDVRGTGEFEGGHIPTAQHRFAPYVAEHLDELDRSRPLAVYCGSGYRAGIAASVLQRHGFDEVYNVPGSITAWKAAGYDTTG